MRNEIKPVSAKNATFTTEVIICQLVVIFGYFPKSSRLFISVIYYKVLYSNIFLFSNFGNILYVRSARIT